MVCRDCRVILGMRLVNLHGRDWLKYACDLPYICLHWRLYLGGELRENAEATSSLSKRNGERDGPNDSHV